MRPVLVIVLATAILGGMQVFLNANRPVAADQHEGLKLIQASGEYAVDVTLTFEAGPDEFAIDAAGDAPSLLVQMNGNELLRRTDTISTDESPIQILGIEGVVVGKNEFFVQASPSDQSSLAAMSARIRITQDGNPVADETIWADGGDILQGTVQLEVAVQ